MTELVSVRNVPNFLSLCILPISALLLMPWAQATTCSDAQPLPEEFYPSYESGSWGYGRGNTRHLSRLHAALQPADLPELEIAWAFGLPDADSVPVAPMVANGIVYVADEKSVVYALDSNTGCTHWAYALGAPISTMVTLAYSGDDNNREPLLVFGDKQAWLYALEPVSGRLRWKVQLDPQRGSEVSATANYYNGILYVPVGSSEALRAGSALFECCRHRASVVAVDASNGELIWQSYTIAEPPRKTRQRLLLPDSYGPSGAVVWSTPTVDRKRGLIYVTTGANHSSPATEHSNALLAMNMTDGRIVWAQQFVANEAWNLSCVGTFAVNCPDEQGVGRAFLAPPLKVSSQGRELLFLAHSDGLLTALDLEADARILWQQHFQSLGLTGGVQSGLAASRELGLLYVPSAQAWRYQNGADAPSAPRLAALNLEDGAMRWRATVEQCAKDRLCQRGAAGAPTVTDSLAFVGGADGRAHAYDAETGQELWQFDTRGEFATVNNVAARGGSLHQGAVVLHGKTLYLASGFAQQGQRPGNVIIALRPAKDNEYAAQAP